MQIDDEVIARPRSLSNVKINLAELVLTDPKKAPQDGKYDYHSTLWRPYLEISSNTLETWVRSVVLKTKNEVVELDAPLGSKARGRQQTLERSRTKRWLYPLAGGLGKAGWAVAMIVALPFLIRWLAPVWEWLARLLPDWEIPWPQINLPSIPWPSINLPSWQPPWIVEVALEYSKVWVPIVIGLIVGVIAVRRARKSRETKAAWKAEEIHRHRQEIAQLLRAHHEQRRGSGPPPEPSSGSLTPAPAPRKP